MAAIPKDDEEKKKRGNYGDAAAASLDRSVNQIDTGPMVGKPGDFPVNPDGTPMAKPAAGFQPGAAPAQQQSRAFPGVAATVPMDATAIADRQAASSLWSGIKDANARAGAAIADIATLPVRGVVGAYDSAVVRPMRAAGINAAYLSPNLVPDGADVNSMTPFYDKFRESDATVAQNAPAAKSLTADIPRPGNPDRLYPTPVDATAAPDGTPKAPEAKDALTNVVTYDPATKTYSGGNVTEGFTPNGSRNGGGNVSVFRGGAQAAMTAPEYQQGFIPAQVRHSGNDWEARNNLRNLDVAASSLTADAKDMMAYKNGLEADKALRETGARSLESQNRDAAFMDRTRAGENAANYRADIVNNIAQQRVNQEGVKLGFESDAAKQLQTLRNQIMTEKDDKKRSVLLDNYQTLTGKFPRPDAAERLTVVQLPDTIDPETKQVMRGGQAAFGADGRRIDLGGGQQQSGIASDPRAIAIKGNTSLSIDEKRKQLQALGYK